MELTCLRKLSIWDTELSLQIQGCIGQKDQNVLLTTLPAHRLASDVKKTKHKKLTFDYTVE